MALRFIPGLGAPIGGFLFSDVKNFEVPDDFAAGDKDVHRSENGKETSQHTVDSKI